jgi:hypothetical protein
MFALTSAQAGGICCVQGMHRLGKRESDQARAKQHQTGNGHSEETVRSEFITHGRPPIVRPCSNGTTVPSHSQKDSLPTSNFDPG